MEHILINLAVRTTKTAVELPVGEIPRVDEAYGVGADVGEQLHDGAGAGELDLAHRDGAGRVELGRLALERVQRIEAEQLVHERLRLRVERARELGALDVLEEVLNDEVLRVRFAEAVEVDEEVVPGFLLLVAVLKGFKGEEGGAPGEGGDDILILAEHVEGGAHVGLVEEVLEDGGGVVGGLLAAEDAAGGLEEVARYLLCDHVVVALPGNGGKVVRVPGADAREVAVSVASACTAANLQTLGSSRTGQGLQTARRSVQVSKQVAAGIELFRASSAFSAAHLAHVLLHPLLVLLVHAHHALASEVKGKGGGQQCQKTDLHHGVVEHLSLAALLVRGIPVLELSPDGAIPRRNRDTARKSATGLHDNVAANPGQGAVDQSGPLRTDVFARVGVDLGEPGEHVYVGNLDLVEQQETVVHGAIGGAWSANCRSG